MRDTSVARTSYVFHVTSSRKLGPYRGEQNLTACGTQGVHKYVAVEMHATLFMMVGGNNTNSSIRGDRMITHLLGESGKLSPRIGHKT